MTRFECPPPDDDYGALLWDQVVSDLDEMGFTFTPTREESKATHPSSARPALGAYPKQSTIHGRDGAK